MLIGMDIRSTSMSLKMIHLNDLLISCTLEIRHGKYVFSFGQIRRPSWINGEINRIKNHPPPDLTIMGGHILQIRREFELNKYSSSLDVFVGLLILHDKNNQDQYNYLSYSEYIYYGY